MAFLKVDRKKSGNYLRILESYRNDKGLPTSRVLYSLGKIEDYTPEQLRRIGIKLFELGGGEVKLFCKVNYRKKAATIMAASKFTV